MGTVWETTISRVHDDTSGTSRSVQRQHGLDGNVHGRGIEGLEHDLSHLLTVGLGVKRGFGQKNGVLLGGNTEFVVKGVVPNLLHIVPVGDNTVLDGVLQSEDPSLGLSLISNEGVLGVHTDHHTSVARASNNRGEDSTGGVITSESGFAHTGSIVHNKGLNFVVAHFFFLLVFGRNSNYNHFNNPKRPQLLLFHWFTQQPIKLQGWCGVVSLDKKTAQSDARFLRHQKRKVILFFHLAVFGGLVFLGLAVFESQKKNRRKMAAFLEGANDLEKLHQLCKRTHKQQAVWFLNAFWDDFAKDEAEKCWNFVEHCVKIDNAGAAGFELDEMEAHRFLEKADEAHTVLEMRSRLRKTGAIGETERPKAVPLSHYLLFKYDNQNTKLFHELVTRTQGDNQKQIEEAQAKLDAVSAAFEEASRLAAAAAAALNDAKAKEADAKAKEADAKAKESAARASESAAKAKEADAKQSAADARTREEAAKASAVDLAEKEEEVRKSQAELEAALAEVKKQEDAYNSKTASLTAKSEDESLGVVTRNRTKNELAQHLAEDPLPLRQAKITAEAALRKAEKATKAAGVAKEVAQQDAAKAGDARAAADADASAASAARAAAEDDAARATASREAAEGSRKAAESSRAAAEQAKAEADAAVDAAEAAVAEAEAFLEEEKKKPGSSHGALWWIDRELHEKKKYMPMRKGGIAK